MMVMTGGARGGGTRKAHPSCARTPDFRDPLSFSIGFLDIRTSGVPPVGMAETLPGHFLCAGRRGKGSWGITSCNPHRSDGKGGSSHLQQEDQGSERPSDLPKNRTQQSRGGVPELCPQLSGCSAALSRPCIPEGARDWPWPHFTLLPFVSR